MGIEGLWSAGGKSRIQRPWLFGAASFEDTYTEALLFYVFCRRWGRQEMSGPQNPVIEDTSS